MSNLFPPEFDRRVYRAANPDLSTLSDRDLRRHFNDFGRDEGRISNNITGRAEFLALVTKTGDVLEVGPFDTPQLVGKNVFYFDVLDREALRQRAILLNRDPDGCPRIDFISPTGDMSLIDRSFDAVFSSHVLEHQPDLIRHLRSVHEILRPNGCYFMFIPDKRYCFDHFIAESDFLSVLAAYLEQRRSHSGLSFLEHRCLLTHNDPQKHWAGDHGSVRSAGDDLSGIKDAIAEWRSLNGGYVDVHAWQFTPNSFLDIMRKLIELGLTSLSVERIYPTKLGSIEFMAILRK